jgi:hypothetical protein
MITTGIRVMREVHHGRLFVESACFGFAMGLCCVGSLGHALIGLGVLLIASILWLRRDQHAVLFPIRIGICVALVYMGPMLLILASEWRTPPSPASYVPGVLVAATMLFVAGALLGVLLRGLFRIFAYSIVIAVEPCCWTCGYNTTGNVSGRCPECGNDLVAKPEMLIAPPTWMGTAFSWLGLSTCLALATAWIISWNGPFARTFDREKTRWTVSLVNGGVLAYRWDSSLNNFTHTNSILGSAAFLESSRSTVSGTQASTLNIPLWLPLALIGIPTYRAWSKRRQWRAQLRRLNPANPSRPEGPPACSHE